MRAINRTWVVVKPDSGPTPETVTVRQLRAEISDLIDTCQRWPIVITRNGTAEAVLISMQDFLEHYSIAKVSDVCTPACTQPSD